MAASFSSSSSHPPNKYDVFLSFRGEDTRYNFTSHVYEVLCQKSIETFMDDQLNRGDEISSSLLDAIEASTISLIIFSQGYASSRWCLDELVKIWECKNQNGQIVIPIFYGIEPEHVRKQTGTFGTLFSALLQRGSNNIKMQTWRNALTEAANLSGFDSRNIRPESELIKEVVNHIEKRLPKVFTWDTKDNLVGVESAVKEIESLLELGSGLKDAYTLGIWGIGGIGKTTIARAIFGRISNNFEGSCFLQQVREESERPGGLSGLKQKLVSQLLRHENVILGIDHLMFRRLSHKKVLIILDDVTCFNQIESIIGSFDWLVPQSRIIITTRNKQVLKNYRVKKIYEVRALGDHRALELFSQHAFKQNHPEIGYREQSKKMIDYAKGVPLALKVLGCFLFEKEKEVWESAINKLEKILHRDIVEILKISYDGLDDKEKSIFLDVACFFKGAHKEPVLKFLDESGFHAEIGISVLVQKSLVIIEDNEITMHDLLQQMGWEIVRQESVNDPGKRSRLWDHEDIINVLTSDTGTEAIEGICLDMGKVNKEICLNPDTFSKMPKLRFLKLYSSIENGENKCKVSHFRGPGLAKVRYLYWHGYPLKSLPSNIHMEELVSLEMPHSNVEQLWNDVHHRGNSNQIIRAACKKLFTGISNPSLTPHPNKLVTLNLSGCKSLKSVPAITHLEFLKDLDLSGCSKLKRLPVISSGNIKRMVLDRTAIKELPSSIECLSSLLSLSLEDCTSLDSLPSNLSKLESLEFLQLSGCSNLQGLPAEFGNLQSLKTLILDRCSNLQRLPEELGNLQSLKSLSLFYCSNLQRLPHKLGNLEALEVLCAGGAAIKEEPSFIFRLKNIRSLNFLRCRAFSGPTLLLSLDGWHKIRYLNLSGWGLTELPESLGQLFLLRELYLGYNKFERIPENIIQLSFLSSLYLEGCERLQSLPKLPFLQDLRTSECTSLESVPALFSSNEYPDEQRINLSDNFKLDGNEIVEDALQKFQLKATARWKHIWEKVDYGKIRGHVILPGNEIPRWFRYQSMGSTVSLKGTAPGLFNNNKIIGFACSAVLAFQHQVHIPWVFGICQFKYESKDADRMDFQISSIPNFISRRLKSDHIYLGYYFFNYEEFNYFKILNCLPDTFHMYFKYISTSKPSDYSPVKKCGISFFYLPEDSNLGMQESEWTDCDTQF